MPSRRTVLTGVAGAAVLAPSACGGASSADDLDDLVRTLSEAADRDQAYRPPRPDERDGLRAALEPIRGGAPAADPGRFGLDPVAGRDPVTGRRWIGVTSRPGDERSWGAVVADQDRQASVLVEVPHLRADLYTEDLGLAVFRALPATVLVIAGAHRDAAGGDADVAHRDDSLFHAVAAGWGGTGLPQLQLHGFHDDSLPGHDAVVSPGAGSPNALVARVAAALDDAGLRVCRAAERDCGSLEGRTNVQGRAAAAAGSPFVHVELNRSTREDGTARDRVAAALARAVGPDPR